MPHCWHPYPPAENRQAGIPAGGPKVMSQQLGGGIWRCRPRIGRRSGRRVALKTKDSPAPRLTRASEGTRAHVTVRRETPDNDKPAVFGVTPSFEAVVSAWDEPVRCQSAYGCRRPASWLAIRHSPCGGHLSVCSVHYRKWVRAAVGRIGRSGRMRCIYCGQSFRSIEECMCFRAL
jgi:hypothetical protein